MGCTSSKLDELPAVALCRERCAFLDEAIHQRYALAEAHVAYIHSLRSLALALRSFFDKDLDPSFVSPPSPRLQLPTQKKGDTQPPASPPRASIHHSHSNSSGSHLHFHSDSDDDDSASDSLHHHLDADSSPVHPLYGHIDFPDHGNPGSYGGFNISYMKNQATPSVVYQHRPTSPGTVHVGESSSYFQYPNNYPNPNGSYPYPNYDSSYGGFFGSSPPQPYASSSPPPHLGPSSVASSSKPPPPPPSPPRSSAWDFLNPFDTFDKYYPPYTPSRDSKEVREEEGIPDLEDEDYQQEVVKEVHGNQKLVDGGGGGGDGRNYSKAGVPDVDGGKVNSESPYGGKPSGTVANDPVEYEVHVVDKKVVDSEARSGDRSNAGASKARVGFSGDHEVINEIKVQFERASELGSELAAMLEVGKLPYNRKHAAYQVSSKLLHAITPSTVVSSQPSTSKNVGSHSDIDEDMGLRSDNLSSTLQKLYIWEKKLWEEVKVEERMRVLHERKCRRLKRLDEKGAEAHKVDSTRALVRSLSTKIRIAIQVVDKISVKINTSRDEELWPQLNEFISGLTRMWKSMLECHRNQCLAIREARRLDAIASHKHLSDAHLDAILQLEHELLNWILRFSCWVGAQKGYIRALNSWLLKCLLYVPEVTPDGIVPFSPSRVGAPPIFIICNQWSQSLERISEKEVVDSMREFATSILQLRERDKLEMRQRMVVNKDVEKKVKNLEREDLKIQKEIQALDKRMVMVFGDDNALSLTRQVVYQSDTSKSISIQVNLQHIFEAMERFTANNLRACEELLQRIREDGLARV